VQGNNDRISRLLCIIMLNFKYCGLMDIFQAALLIKPNIIIALVNLKAMNKKNAFFVVQKGLKRME
jgi:hypothetical protein